MGRVVRNYKMFGPIYTNIVPITKGDTFTKTLNADQPLDTPMWLNFVSYMRYCKTR